VSAIPAEPTPAEPAATVVAATPATVVAATPAIDVVVTAHRSHRLRFLAGLRWLIARTVAIVLFVAGVALGYGAFVANQPPPTIAVDPATNGVVAPAVVREFVEALISNDPSALRSAVPTVPYQQLIAEMGRWDFQTMTDVETLSTYVDGPRSATELVMSGTSTAGVPLSVNLVVQVDDGQIASFR
jgi:hypothetical protein